MSDTIAKFVQEKRNIIVTDVMCNINGIETTLEMIKKNAENIEYIVSFIGLNISEVILNERENFRNEKISRVIIVVKVYLHTKNLLQIK